ncbi:MAG: NAD(P)/FAD-dependent oxidoreductase [Nocardioides sp.]
MTDRPPADLARVDLAIVGAGPAGAAAALGALAEAPDLRVLLLDRADFPRDKCCGDGIAPHVLDVLDEVGAGDAADGWKPVHRLELTGARAHATGRLTRPVWVIPRAVFDARLVERAVAAGAQLVRHRVSHVRRDRESDGWVIDDRFAARVVVGADGAHSVVRAVAGLQPSTRRALALRGYAPTPEHRRGLQIITFGDRRQPSYAWSFDRGDGLSNVGYGELLGTDGRDSEGVPTRKVLLEELERLLPGAATTGTRWRGHHLPLSGWRWVQPDGSVLLAGDAAGLVNPMTGEGIYYAVATGVAAGRGAAQAIAADRPAGAGAEHRRVVRRLLGTHLRHTSTVSLLSRSPRVVDAGIRGSARSGRVFDDVVEIGLGRGLVTPRLAASLAAGLIAGLATRSATDE